MTPEREEDKMLAYFMGQTNERLLKIEEKLVELIAFRAEVKAEAKNQAVIISLVLGFLSFVAQVVARKMGFM